MELDTHIKKRFMSMDKFIQLLNITEYLGEIKNDKVILMQQLATQFFNGFDNLFNQDIEFIPNKIGYILEVFERNNIEKCEEKITKWIEKYVDKILDNSTDINSTFCLSMEKYIGNTQIGKDLISVTEYIPQYDKIINNENAEEIIVKILTSDYANKWDVIKKTKTILGKKVWNKIIFKLIDLIQIDVFKSDLLMFSAVRYIKLITHFKQFDRLNTIQFKNTIKFKNAFFDALICKDEGNVDKIIPIKSADIFNTGIYETEANHFVQMYDIYNVEYKWWSKIGDVDSFYEIEGKKGIVINIKLLHPFQNIKIGSPLIINKKIGEQLNILSIEQLFFKHNEKVFERDRIIHNTTCEPISYVIMFENDMIDTIKVGDVIYM